MTDRFEGKVALVTGGSRGLGAAIVRGLAAKGAKVAFSYVSARDRAAALTHAIRDDGGEAHHILADQADPEAVAVLIEQVIGQFGRLDILVCNASIDVHGSIDDPARDRAAQKRFWAVALTGFMATVAAASRVIADSGRIVMVGSSLGGRAAFPGLSDIAAAKGAIDGFCGGVARDLAPRKITVNVVHAGPMDTEIHAAAGSEALAPVFGQMCFPRYGELEEIVAPILFLASSGASFITGSAIEANGGFDA